MSEIWNDERYERLEENTRNAELRWKVFGDPDNANRNGLKKHKKDRSLGAKDYLPLSLVYKERRSSMALHKGEPLEGIIFEFEKAHHAQPGVASKRKRRHTIRLMRHMKYAF